MQPTLRPTSSTFPADAVGGSLFPRAAPRLPPAVDRSNEAPGQERAGADGAVRKAFDDFVGQTLFGQMLGALRSSVGKPAYFHGGRAEDVFQGQLDQMLAERMAHASAGAFSDPMFDLYSLPRT
ncbi:MAG: hypothetical protein FJ297_05435 [Planctomycetes bacterium]|nr:hypothetical protein [Planctomycetota bacterium]